MTDDVIGKTIGGYEVLDVIGRGGMATVFRAQQKSMNNRIVALKVLPTQYVNDDTYIQRFNQEVAIVARLEHRNIVPVYDYGEYEGRPYIAMRYMSAGSVDDQLNTGALDIEQIVNIYEQIAPALDYAHSKNVLHRDLKPSNVLLDDDGGAYLTDFGIARILGEQNNPGITTQGVVGTPSYMSPEQAQGHPLDNRSDIYALGVMLFELATGRRPFESDTPYSIAVMQVTTPTPSPRIYNPSLSLALEEVIFKAMRKKREERYPHAIALSEGLKRALNKQVISIHDTQPGFPRPQPPAPQQQPVQSSPPMIAAAPPVYSPPPVQAMTPNPATSGYVSRVARRRKARGSGIWMSAAVGGLIGCGLLTALVIVILIVISTMTGGGNPLIPPTRTPVPPDAQINGDGSSFAPTLDETSSAARDALLANAPTPRPPDSPTDTPGIAPVGVRETPIVEPIAVPVASSGQTLIFFAEREENFDLYRLDLDTEEETRLTFDPAPDSYPSVSPDGQKIIFQSNRDGDYDIFLMDISGENLQKLTNNYITDRLPAWSPDGEWIVFSSDNKGDDNLDLMRMRSDGSDLQVVYSDGKRNSHPRYSPDGEWIVFTTGDPGDGSTWDVAKLELASDQLVILTSSGSKDWSPSFSPDGQSIVYLTTGEGARGNAAIASMRSDGSDNHIIYDENGYEWGATYSPDGSRIAFTSMSRLTALEEVFVMAADGTALEQLTDLGGQGPVWVP